MREMSFLSNFVSCANINRIAERQEKEELKYGSHDAGGERQQNCAGGTAVSNSGSI